MDPTIIEIDSDKVIASPSSIGTHLLDLYTKYKPFILTIVFTIVSITVLAIGLVFGLVPRSDISRPNDPYTENSAKRLSYFDSSALEGYGQCAQMKEDLELAANFIISAQVDVNVRRKFHESNDYYWIPRGGLPIMGDDAMTTTVAEDAPMKESSAGAGASESNTEDSYETNNQVDGVDEADLVKSDGNVVYAGYGDQLVIWDATDGIELSRTTLPTDDDNGILLCGDDGDDKVYKVVYDEPLESTSTQSSSSSSATTNCYQGRITISSLLLHQNRLLVVASAPTLIGSENDQDANFILSGYHSTRLFIYDITAIPNDKSALTLLGRKDLQGSYKTARSIGQYAHVVTTSYVDTWYHLERHIYPWSEEYNGLLENEYRKAAYEASEAHVPIFAERLLTEILDSHDITDDESACEHVSKVALMLSEKEGSNRSEKETLSFTTDAVLQYYTQVHSFDLLEDLSSTTETGNITTSSSGVFLPTAAYTNAIYSSKTKLVLSGNAYSEDIDGEWLERTILLTFDLRNEKSIAHSIGEVPGSVLNQFSMDHYDYVSDDGNSSSTNSDEYIRVATTTWARFSIIDGIWTQAQESTNQVTVLKLPSSGSNSSSMEIVGQATGMGAGERIYAARFIKEKGYVVTFRQIDPFYTLDLSDPTNPKVVGELKIPGFSNYLHPVSDDLILALGQDANDRGVVQGLQIALFDVSNFTDPQQVQKYVEKGYSSSDAQYDHKAFRYLPESKLLILPMYVYNEPYFDGFIVYDVDESSTFQKLFNISHKEDGNDYSFCWDSAVLPSRSLVFDGKVTTMKQHNVLSHDLDTMTKQWELNLDANRTEDDDNCFYWRDEVIFF